ncbi:hypothetical protein PG994_011583 [Apiospora phragmitis]|uniref:Uncharacterized protein n=1 Tax=Apiospora phragmitis TaxID=2905665 RepID=A0ABR1TTF3_9PEZI
MQNFLAVILLAVAALEGVVAAPLADAAAVDVRTNDKFPDAPAFDGVENIYGRDLAEAEDDEKQNSAIGGGAPATVADAIPLDSAPELSEEPAALGPRSADIEERDLDSEDDGQLEARDVEEEDNSGLEKRDAGVAVVEVDVGAVVAEEVEGEEVSPQTRPELLLK